MRFLCRIGLHCDHQIAEEWRPLPLPKWIHGEHVPVPDLKPTRERLWDLVKCCKCGRETWHEHWDSGGPKSDGWPVERAIQKASE